MPFRVVSFGTVASTNLPARQGISSLRRAHTPDLIGGSGLSGLLETHIPDRTTTLPRWSKRSGSIRGCSQLDLRGRPAITGCDAVGRPAPSLASGRWDTFQASPAASSPQEDGVTDEHLSNGGYRSRGRPHADPRVAGPNALSCPVRRGAGGADTAARPLAAAVARGRTTSHPALYLARRPLSSGRSRVRRRCTTTSGPLTRVRRRARPTARDAVLSHTCRRPVVVRNRQVGCVRLTRVVNVSRLVTLGGWSRRAGLCHSASGHG